MNRFIKIVTIISAAVVIVLIAFIAPIDRTPLEEQPFYKEMLSRLDTLSFGETDGNLIYASWSKVNITPNHTMPMAGYRPRSAFSAVHDSIYARIVLLNQNQTLIYFITADLLIFPPALKERIFQILTLENSPRPFIYFSATHTHNSVGGWNPSLLGSVAVGEYNEQWIDSVATIMVRQMKAVNAAKAPARLAYLQADASELVVNRIVRNNTYTDGQVRGLAVYRNDSTRALLFTYSAHATSISSKSLEISGDYPSAIMNKLEASGWNFSSYMAGMVGSHRFAYAQGNDWEIIDRNTDSLVKKIVAARADLVKPPIMMRYAQVPIAFGPSQVRIHKNFKVRDWVFRSIATPLRGEITYLQIGEVVFIATPSDFSGEIYVRNNWDSLAARNNKKLIITSFNGEYVGYITYDGHYENSSHSEVNVMNWVGPYYGEYFTRIIESLMLKE